jgi:putative addiction module component (TIGR02574 family)
MIPSGGSVFDLSPSEKLQLVEDLWDDLATDPETIAVHDWQKDELARRKANLLSNPASGLTWEGEAKGAQSVWPLNSSSLRKPSKIWRGSRFIRHHHGRRLGCIEVAGIEPAFGLQLAEHRHRRANAIFQICLRYRAEIAL